MGVGIIVLVLFGVLVGTFLYRKYSPSKEMANLDEYFHISKEEDTAIILGGQRLEAMAKLEDGKVYVDYVTLHDAMDARYYWDATESKLLYTTPENTYMVESETDNYYIGRKVKQVKFGTIVKLDAEKVWINLDYIKEITGIKYNVYKGPNRVVIEVKSRKINSANVKKDTQIRLRGGVKSPILTQVAKNSKVMVLEEGDNWSRVATEDGFDGYMKKSAVGDKEKETIKVKKNKVEYKHIFKEGTIKMAWQQVTNQYANTQLVSSLGKTKGLNVVSPTWFYLSDNNGNIGSLADIDYVNYCHSKGIEVWGLVSNLVVNSVDSAKVLCTTTSRETLVSSIVSKAIQYKLDGINVDFEALKPEVGDGYIQFIRELSLKCHANDLILSVDNYVPTAYTAFYKRAEQANYADYVVIMAYDEHYAGSEAGSVSSIDFVKAGVKNTLKEVPKEQVILGLPFYTRVWELTPKKDGDSTSYTTKSQAVSMGAAANMAKVNGAIPKWKEEFGQNYVEYETNGKIYQIWMEDDKSLGLKLSQATDNGLAGVTFWKLGFENESVWNTVLKYID